MAIPLSIIWHQHQPYYKDLSSGEMVLPWVRLHGVKDYYGMAKLLSEFPGVKCAINLVPSMLAQLLDYVHGKASDPFLRRTEIHADALSSEDACFILDNFFMAQWDRMIRIYPRYAELLHMRKPGRRGTLQALDDFKKHDLRDLQAWFNLAWFHPVSFEESATLRELVKKGSHFTEQDKEAILLEQKRVLAQVIPLHRELAERGQVELTTTPYYHPILPLLCDMRSALVAMPNVPLPSGHTPLRNDAELHVRKAVDFHRELFGHAPEGMWPAEGSVSPEIVPLLAAHGIRWMATDEEILAASLKERIRGDHGKLERPDLLYRPWSCESQGAHVNVLFRDHHLSDLVGFHYQNWEGLAAAEDFVKQIEQSGRGSPCGDETLVTVILDGENCWEHYPHQGVVFLRSLYAKLEKAEHNIHTVRPGDFIKSHYPSHKVEHLFSGSWINHDFHIWIGHAEDRRAWEYVYRTREDLVEAQRAKGDAADDDMALAHAWEELLIAEGSDWYWWYGDDHNSGNDDAFDSLFRTHLANVYKFIGQPVPFFLSEPVKGRSTAGRYTTPTVSLDARIDGHVHSYFEWLGAGRYRPDKDGGVMTAAGRASIEQIHFGYGRGNLFIRIDFPEDLQIHEDSEARPIASATIRFHEPKGLELKLNSKDLHPVWVGHWAKKDGLEMAWHQVLEMKIPFEWMGVKSGDELAFYVEVTAASRTPEQYPRSSPLQLTVPPENAHEYEWIA
jgi:alpha-amylase/alpha-mannosidase (GH57 family)